MIVKMPIRLLLGDVMTINDFDHVILLAHGSTDPLWKQPFEAIHDKICRESGVDYCSLAYMELTEPTFEQVVEGLDPSIKRIAVLPLFFAVGRHLRHDVPAQIAAMAGSTRDIKLLPPIGDDPRIQQTMVDIVKTHLGK
jgi:sirohydrochlorin cobaltochelatase